MNLQWTSRFPYVARVPAPCGGTWLLILRPATDLSLWSWSVQYSSGEPFRGGGVTGSPNFSKGQAERPVARMDAADPAHPGIAPGRK